MKRILFFLFFLSFFLGVHSASLVYATFNIRYANGDRGMAGRCWEDRRDSVAGFILAQKTDIIGMQEVLHEQLIDLQRLLPAYDYEGVGREDGKEQGEYAPIFWLRKDWTKLKGGTFWLSSTPDSVGSVGWDAALTRIATYVLLQNKQSGKQLICINTHFDHVGHEARQQSALLIMRKAQEIAGNTPCVLTGDLNVTMDDAAYQVMTHTQVSTLENDSLSSSHAFLLDTYMEGAPHTGPFYTFHEFCRIPVGRCGKIDYIFASPSIQVESTLIYQEDRSGNPRFLSDHNPIVAHLVLP